VTNTLITDEERALLYLFLDDLRDHEIAARLYISVRTVQRRLERLMLVADAHTRFGLGAKATKMGWIDP
jgi:DNA-binding NarL/FixJ family response regulator